METRRPAIEPGAIVEATDGKLGVVDQVIVRPETGELAYLIVSTHFLDPKVVVPASQIAQVPTPNQVKLRVSEKEAREQAAAVPPEALARAEGTDLHIPLHEERLQAGTRAIDLGEVRLHRTVESEEQVIRQPIMRDQVDIERIAKNEIIETVPPARYEDDWFVVPVVREELVVQRRLVLAEEVRVRRRQVTEDQELHETVRRERIEVENAARGGTLHVMAGSAGNVPVPPADPPSVSA